MYKAMDVAKYVIDFCTRRGTPVSNLQLQKILYYIQINFYRRFEEFAFFDDIQAWRYGPVVADVYERYSRNGSADICEYYDDAEDIFEYEEDVQLAEMVIRACLRKSPWDLVALTHRKGGPWDKTYRNGLGDKDIIPKEYLIHYANNRNGE